MLWRARKRGIRNIRHDRIFELNISFAIQSVNEYNDKYRWKLE